MIKIFIFLCIHICRLSGHISPTVPQWSWLALIISSLLCLILSLGVVPGSSQLINSLMSVIRRWSPLFVMNCGSFFHFSSILQGSNISCAACLQQIKAMLCSYHAMIALLLIAAASAYNFIKHCYIYCVSPCSSHYLSMHDLISLYCCRL